MILHWCAVLRRKKWAMAIVKEIDGNYITHKCCVVWLFYDKLLVFDNNW